MLSYEPFQHHAKVKFEGFPLPSILMEKVVRVSGTPSWGHADLRAEVSPLFDFLNRTRLPFDTVFNTAVGDADLDGDGRIFGESELAALRDESRVVEDMARDYGIAVASIGVHQFYKILREVTQVKLGDPQLAPLGVEFDQQACVRTELGEVPTIQASTEGDLPNDTLVTIDSGHGGGALEYRVFASGGFSSSVLRKDNHAGIGSGLAGTSAMIDWLREAEKKHGDLPEQEEQ
jgi:hypothetical protein